MDPKLPTSSDAGQVPSDPSLIDLMQRNVAALVRTSAVLTKLSERLDVIEKRLDEGEPGPVTEERPTPPVGRLALRHDGAVMLEVTSDVTEDDLKDREVARFVTLNQAEAADAIERADVGFCDAASRAAWQLARARKGYPVEPTEPTEPTS